MKNKDPGRKLKEKSMNIMVLLRELFCCQTHKHKNLKNSMRLGMKNYIITLKLCHAADESV
jgi:hypothetical protein